MRLVTAASTVLVALPLVVACSQDKQPASETANAANGGAGNGSNAQGASSQQGSSQANSRGGSGGATKSTKSATSSGAAQNETSDESGGATGNDDASGGADQTSGTSSSGGATSSENSAGGSTSTKTGSTSSGGSQSTATVTTIVVPCADSPNPEKPDVPCSQWKDWNNCDQSWMIEGNVCDKTCGRCTGDTIKVVPIPGGGGNSGAGGSTGSTSATTTASSGPTLAPLTNGQPGFTTRYWDCCKPHCGWPGNASKPIASCDRNNGRVGDNSAKSACEGGNAHMCWNYGPRANGDNIAYAFAAHNGVGCGTCFQLEFTGESHDPKPDTGHDAGSQSLKGKQMIVQVINTGGIESGQFDLLVPGGGVGEFNACSSQWGTSDLGEQYGGFFLDCQKKNDFDYELGRECAKQWCSKVFTGKSELLAGCMWFVEWFGMADNPTMKFAQVSCPQQLTQISGM